MISTGVLRGQDLNIVMSNAPQIAQRIARHMGVSVGELKELASQGKVTADIVKQSILGAADDINQQFEDMPMTFTHLAKVLSSDYINLFYVNIKNDKYIEYSSDSAVERHGNDFFEASRNDALRLISKKDQELFKRAFNKDTILRAIDDRGSFTLSYRLMIDGVPTFVSLKAVKAKDDPDHLVIGVNNVDAQIRQQEAFDHLKNERDKYSRIAALSGEAARGDGNGGVMGTGGTGGAGYAFAFFPNPDHAAKTCINAAAANAAGKNMSNNRIISLLSDSDVSIWRNGRRRNAAPVRYR